MNEKPSLQILKLRIVDAAARYFHACKSFERTQGDEEADKELRIANTELLRAYGKFLRELKKSPQRAEQRPLHRRENQGVGDAK